MTKQAIRAGANNWADKKIIFVSGKGGVGKSLVAAGIARAEAAKGRSVLLVEVGESSYYKDFWRLAHAGHDPAPVPGERFDLALWSGESCLREYVLYYLKLERLYKLFFENKIMRSLVNIAPGLPEISILGKITSGIRQVGPPLEYDLIVVDTYATGHALALFRAPRGMMEAIGFGPMGHHSREIDRVLRDMSACGFALVTLLEELPVVETAEFCQTLKEEFGVEADIICNRVLPVPVSEAELGEVERHAGHGLREFTVYLAAVRDRQAKFLAQLKKLSPRIRRVPQIFSQHPAELVHGVATALSSPELSPEPSAASGGAAGVGMREGTSDKRT